MPLYCYRTMQETKDLVLNNQLPLSHEKLKYLSTIALNHIGELVGYNYSGVLSVNDRNMLDLRLYGCEKILYGIIQDKNKYHRSYLEDLLLEAFLLLDELRYIWRRDNDIHIKIMLLLVNNGNDLMNDYYRRMYLYSAEQIREYVTEQDSMNEFTEKDYECVMDLLGIGREVRPQFDTMNETRDKYFRERKGRIL